MSHAETIRPLVIYTNLTDLSFIRFGLCAGLILFPSREFKLFLFAIVAS